MKRIFTFGCSFTDYSWPTWADLILHKNKGLNYGICGGGFEQIMNSLVQCDKDYKLTDTDQIIIVYPNLLRWDMPFYPNMLCVGNALTSPWKDHLDVLYNLEGLTYKNLNLMVMIDNFLKQKKVHYRYSSILPLFEHPENYFLNVEFGDEIKNHLDYVKRTVMHSQLTDFYTFLYGRVDQHPIWEGTKKWKNEEGKDYHPTISSHYKWLTNILMPSLYFVDLHVDLSEAERLEQVLMEEIETKEVASAYFEKAGYFDHKHLIFKYRQAKLNKLI